MRHDVTSLLFSGLRAIAVIPVVLFHFHLSFPGGFAGVDVFFTISGYLITAILMSKLAKNKFSLAEFFTRRCRRLFPALAILLASTLTAGWYLLLQPAFNSLVQQTTAVLLFGANFHFYKVNDYFAASSDMLLLHCWSLAVEGMYNMLFWSTQKE